jgi:hypothetical protein
MMVESDALGRAEARLPKAQLVKSGV